MDNLIEIINIVKGINLKVSDFITIDDNNETQPSVLYHKVLNGEIHSDKEAAHFFFQSGTNTPKYKNLKYYLKERLLNTIFFIKSPKHYGDYNRSYIYCCKNFFAAKMLMNFGARNSGTDLCEKVFKKALQVELTEFIISAARYLRIHYGTILGNLEKFRYYDEQYEYFLKVSEAEREAESYYVQLMIPYATSQSLKEETHENATKFYQELDPILKEYSSPILHFYGTYIRIQSALVVNDYPRVIEYAKEGISFFEQKDYTYITPLRVFYHNLLIGYTQLNDFKTGKQVASKAEKLISPNTYTWYLQYELLLILALRSAEYTEAIGIINLIFKSRKFSNQTSAIIERWHINAAYVQFLISIGKMEGKDLQIGKFRLGKFINSLPTYSKDKRGLNIPILIIQFLFMITQNKYDEAIDRTEAIKKYTSRYIRKGENLRSHCFLNMLLLVPSCSFHKAAVIRKTTPWLKKLEANPIEIANQPHEVEIIPYEDLWGYVLDHLEYVFH